MMKKSPLKIGMALSGGGARGIAHIGALQALEDHGFEPVAFSGSSAGAIVGCLYAAGYSPKEILEIVKEASIFKLFTMSLPYTGLTKHTFLHDLLKKNIEKNDFSTLKKKLYVAISNLNTGELEIRSEGTLFEVIMASSSIPLVFQPVEIDGQLYVDGGILDNLPVSPLVGQVDYIIGINVMPDTPVEKKSIKTVFGIVQRCFDLSILANTRPSVDLCDLLIEPEKVQKYNIFQLNRYKEIYDIGYEAMAENIEELQAVVTANL
jgi:NTE family protein